MPAISEVSKVYLNALMDNLLESGWSWDGYLTFPLFNAVAAVGTASITFLRDEEHAQTNSAPGATKASSLTSFFFRHALQA